MEPTTALDRALRVRSGDAETAKNPSSIGAGGRHQPESLAKQRDYPDPAEFNIANCPYCIDSREQVGTNLAGCLRHA